MTDTLPPPPPTAAAPVATVAPNQGTVERKWIILEESSDIPPTGLPLSVNGEAIMIMPGEPVHIPLNYLEVLDQAIIDVPVLNGSQQITGSRQKRRFPYREVPAPAVA
jgi:hypothetical protein